jgi:diguanylate cyclase (GGDEF)-like protein
VLGPPYIRAYAGVQLRTPDGYNLGALCAIDTKPRCFEAKHIALLKDLADLVMSEFVALMQARTDSLTGALTRRAFRYEAERVIELSSRQRHPLSCTSFDLDHFKAINDAHGHAAGDRVLVEAALVCRERLRSSDIFGRLGGEEFTIILPYTVAAGALRVAEQIRTALERLGIQSDPAVRVTGSFGIVGCQHADAPLDELLRRADLALYAAKEAGRNASVVWRPPADSVHVGRMRRVLKAGQIVFNSGRSVIDCSVRGICEEAARLDVISTAGIPGTFKLAIPADGVSRVCNVTAKQERKLEVSFA